MRPRSRVSLLGLGLLAGALLLEGVLQGVAWTVWSRARPAETRRASEGKRVVLCVGDSFTFGYGASSTAGSYPAQVARLLERSGTGPWDVANLGWPGQDSRDVLARLAGQLAALRPEWVLILVGGNDAWSRPELLDVAETSDEGVETFPIRWRTGRLLTLLARRAAPEIPGGTSSPPVAPAELLGDWILGETPIRFEPDGDLRVPAGTLRWSAEGEGLTIRLPSGSDLRFRWELVTGDLLLTDAQGRTAHHLVRRDAPARTESANAVAAGWQAIQERAFGPALTLFAARLEKVPEDPLALGGLAVALHRLDRTRDSARATGRLRALHEERGDAGTGEALLGVLREMGKRSETLAFAEELVGIHPDTVSAWVTIAEEGRLAGEDAASSLAVERVLDLTEGRHPLWRAKALRLRAERRRDSDPDLAIRDVVEAFLLDGDEKQTRMHLAVGWQSFTRERVEACLDLVAPPEGRRREFERLLGRVGGTPTRVPEVLKAHWRQMVRLCRARGARPVLLAYPFPDEVYSRSLEEASRENGVDAIWPRGEFERRLRTTPRGDLFVADGHCTDEGYGVIASLAAEFILERIR